MSNDAAPAGQDEAADISAEMKAKIRARSASLFDVLQTTWALLSLGHATEHQRNAALCKLVAMSLALVAMTAAQYAFAPLVGTVLEAATTPGEREDYQRTVVGALLRPLALSCALLAVQLTVTWWWLAFTIAFRRDVGLRLNQLLDKADKEKLDQLVDTPGQRLQVDVHDFCHLIVSHQGLIHAAVQTTASLITGAAISIRLLGPGALACVILYAALQTGLEIYVVSPMQSNAQELSYAIGTLRQNLGHVAADSVTASGEKISLEEVQTSQHALYTVNVRLMVIQFRMLFVRYLGRHFKDYIVVYVIALLPVMIGLAEAPRTRDLTENTITLHFLLDFFLSLSELMKAWFRVAGLRTRVQDMYDALVASQGSEPATSSSAGSARDLL